MPVKHLPQKKEIAMRRILLLVITCITVHVSLAQKECVSANYLQQQISNSPALAGKMADIEKFISHRLNNREIQSTPSGGSTGSLSVIKIPVVVHVLYNTPGQKISEAQVKSQIDVLNKEFRKLHSDVNKIPVAYQSLAADCYLEFSLATIAPDGKATNGIIWKQTSIQYFGIDDRIKYSGKGGDDAWDCNKYLNIWVGNMAGGILGYSSPVGGPKDRDGIVIRNTAFGTINTAPATNKGRTAVHEIGHWLGLRHIWGDQYCGDDGVDDTPPQRSASNGCPSGVIVSCSNTTGNMYMNYMDLTDDGCTNMFTIGQRNKMRILFETGGTRHALLSSNGCSGTPLPQPIDAVANDAQPTNIAVFPNPAFNTITIDLTNTALSGLQITIHNHLGQQVMQSHITQKQQKINVSALKTGMYFIRIGDDKKAYKFSKM